MKVNVLAIVGFCEQWPSSNKYGAKRPIPRRESEGMPIPTPPSPPGQKPKIETAHTKRISCVYNSIVLD